MLGVLAKREAFISYGSRCEWDPDGGGTPAEELNSTRPREGGSEGPRRRIETEEAEFQVPVAPVCAPSCASVRS